MAKMTNEEIRDELLPELAELSRKLDEALDCAECSETDEDLEVNLWDAMAAASAGGK